MTDESPPETSQQTETTEKTEIEKLRDEFSEQFSTLKNSYEKTAAEQADTIASLKKENEDLRRALIRNVTIDPSPQPIEKTPEQLEKEKIQSLSQKSLEILKRNIT